MRIFRFRRKPKQKVGGKDFDVDEKIAASVKQAILESQPKRRRRHLFVDARAELRRINKEEAEQKRRE